MATGLPHSARPRGHTTTRRSAAGTLRRPHRPRAPAGAVLYRGARREQQLPPGLPVRVQGIAFSGCWRGQERWSSRRTTASWVGATLGADHGPYSFRTWEHTWRPSGPRQACDRREGHGGKGHVQLDAPVWKPGRLPVETGSSARNWSSAPPSRVGNTMTGSRYLGLVLLAAAGVLDPGSRRGVRRRRRSPARPGGQL